MSARGTLLLLALTLAPLAQASVPAGWPAPRYQFEGNPQTPAGFELGRRLFYDPALSRDGTVSCASCHQQAAGFAHNQHRLSHGIGGRLGTRNAPALANLAWQPDFMQDGAATHLETQPLLPLVNPVEMDQPVARAVDVLRADPSYAPAFEAAFGSPGIDTQRMLRALAQFTGALVSRDALYDRVQAGRAQFTPLQARGLASFRAQCAACHAEPLFSSYEYRSNGLDAEPKDPGRQGISGRPEDRGLFRVPSLRNVAVTAPYMHDGRYATLEQALAHYAGGVVASTASEPLRSHPPQLAAEDLAALRAFLDTLTDSTFLHDARFAEPPPPAPPAPPLPRRVLAWLADVFGVQAQASAAAPGAFRGRGGTLALSAGPFEVVTTRVGGELLIYVDEAASNRPVAGLSAQVQAGGVLLQAAPRGPGLYAAPADRLDPRRAQPLTLRLRGAGQNLDLAGTLPAAGPRP